MSLIYFYCDFQYISNVNNDYTKEYRSSLDLGGYDFRKNVLNFQLVCTNQVPCSIIECVEQLIGAFKSTFPFPSFWEGSATIKVNNGKNLLIY